MDMKKIFQYSFAALAGLVLASCNGNYDDWASPQGYDQEDPAAAYGVNVSAGADANIVMPVANDDVKLVSFSASSEDVKSFAVKSLMVNGDEISYNVQGNNVVVSAHELNAIVEQQYNSRASVKREIKVDTEVSLVLKNGDAVTTGISATTSASLTPKATPAIDSKGYYILGSFVDNNWDLANPIWMTDEGNGIYSAVVTLAGDGGHWYKFYGGSYWDASDWDIANQGQMGCAVDGDPALSGFIIHNGDQEMPYAPRVDGDDGSLYKITIDMNNLTYKVVRQAVNYYIVGGPNDWGASAASKELKFNQANIEVPVYTIVFPAKEGDDTWFAIGDDKACDAIANDNNYKLLFGTTSGNGNQGTSGTLARRDALTDDGSFKVAAGAKFIKVTLDMGNMTYTCAPLNFGEYIYEAGTNNDWGTIEQPLYCADGEGTYTGFFYSEGADWNGGKGAFKFQGAFNSWNDGNYGYASGDETSGTLVDDGSSGNISVTPGFYRADIDLANMTYKMTPINTVFVVGSAVNNDWDHGVEMTYNVAERCWQCTATLNDGQIKFKGNGTWDSIDGNWGGTLDNIINDSQQNIDVPVTGEVLIKFYPRCDTKSYATIVPAN